MKRWIVLVLCLALLFCSAVPARTEKTAGIPRPSSNGRLHVEGTQLTDAAGNAVQLRGVSTHGVTWYPETVSENLFRQISGEWNCSLIRLAVYSAQYCDGGKEQSLALTRKGIDAAIAADMYAIVDWHILTDSDPNENKENAKEFFTLIASEYADCPNLIFEICNEPNGETAWSDVKKYAEEIIPLIRTWIPDALILVGTPEFCRNLGDPILRPLAWDNVMYVLHFYAATHGEGLRNELKAAADAGLPVFISECGISEADGDGRLDFASAAQWFAYLNEKQISYAVWSLSSKEESSAFFRFGFKPEGVIRDEDLSVSGAWVRELIRGADPMSIPAPAAQVEKSRLSRMEAWIIRSLGERGSREISLWILFACISGGALIAAAAVFLHRRKKRKKQRLTYNDIIDADRAHQAKGRLPGWICLILGTWSTLVYLCWRIVCSIPFEYGILAVAGNLILLIVEIVGFAETLILYRNLLGMRSYPLPEIPADAWPDVDIFVSTYNEPTDLLRRTLNGCVHMKYPDPGKVHIWLCDDHRRPEMRALAEEMGVGYFDRPDNKGAKAGNLNHAMGLTSAPYIVTFDADMIPRSDFLLKTIPYFVEQVRPENERLRLGLLQTPQSFYDPDVFQHALYCEKRAPNEQDFFYRTIEPAKTSSNSVIYGGSNTVLSRKALEDIGGFYTGSITEDFATGLLIESAGYVSLSLPEPLASGQTPHTFREHIQQRIRWGRGVILTARKLRILGRRDLRADQKVSYLSSVTYWYSPLKNLIYMISPLLFAAFMIPVFRCNWLELLVFWLPMFVLQDLSLKLNSRNTISVKWSGIYETSVMPHLLIPILKESLGISLSTFKVTDKSGRSGQRTRDLRAMAPFLCLVFISIVGIVRVLLIFEFTQTIGLLILLFWILRNLYYLVMALFLIDGRDSDGETVEVNDAEIVRVTSGGKIYEGVTTLLTEHNLTVFLDDGEDLMIGAPADVEILKDHTAVKVSGTVTGRKESRRGTSCIHMIEILDDHGNRLEYLQLLYDRIPTLPQSLRRDFGAMVDLWQNIAHRVARTIRQA